MFDVMPVIRLFEPERVSLISVTVIELIAAAREHVARVGLPALPVAARQRLVAGLL